MTGPDPDADVELVLASYGRAMLTAQVVEQYLDALWTLSFGEQRPNAHGRGDAKAWRRMLAALEEATPRKVARALAPQLDKQLTGQLEDMFRSRDLLAGSYLREQVRRGSSGPRFDEGTHRRLVELHERWSAVARALEAMIDRAAEKLGDGIAAWPAEARAAVEAAQKRR